MYPDTDSAPIPLEEDQIEQARKNLPSEVIARYHKLKDWGVPEDAYTYIFSKNLYPVIEETVKSLGMDPKFTGTFIGHYLKWVEGHFTPADNFNYRIIYAMFRYLKEQGLEPELARRMLPVVYEHPKMDFDSVLTSIRFKKVKKDEIFSKIPFLREKFSQVMISGEKQNEVNWIMGELRNTALGNIPMQELRKAVENNSTRKR